MEKQSGGPAFPQSDLSGYGMGPQTSPDGLSYQVAGMTLRDWFAGKAMQALIAKSKFMDTLGQNGKPISPDDMEQFRLDIAASSLEYADAMIAERSRS